MRIWLISSLFLFAFCISSPTLYAQDSVEPAETEMPIPDLPEETSLPSDALPDASDTAEKTAKPKNVYARATYEQIGEAERFYKKCTTNDEMKNRKDCKCAAAAYLEARIILGKDAKIDEIMKINRNKCLKNKDDAIPENAPDIEVTEAQFKEAEEVYAFCKTNERYQKRFKCDCFAARFLDERIKKGPMVDRDTIMNSLRSECRNIVEQTGAAYSSCMSRPMLMNLRGIELKDFCECYAREWGRIYEAYDRTINMSAEDRIARNARSACMDPGMYQ
ncbi:MAG: hypothetical protein ACRBDL_05785 [Alphaproteobacteria bacterium]